MVNYYLDKHLHHNYYSNMLDYRQHHSHGLDHHNYLLHNTNPNYKHINHNFDYFIHYCCCYTVHRNIADYYNLGYSFDCRSFSYHSLDFTDASTNRCIANFNYHNFNFGIDCYITIINYWIDCRSLMVMAELTATVIELVATSVIMVWLNS